MMLTLGATLLAGCGGGAAGGSADGSAGTDSLAVTGAVAAPPARPSLKETTFSGVPSTDPVATQAYDYVAEFNELMVLPSVGRLEARHTSGCTKCTALTSLVEAQVKANTHYEKPIWRITTVVAKGAGLYGTREVTVLLEPIKEPVLTRSGEKVALGPEWKRTVTLELSPRAERTSSNDAQQWEISGTAIAEG